MRRCGSGRAGVFLLAFREFLMLRRYLVAAAALTLASPLSAQVIGLPVVNSGVPVGIQLAADVGFPNADAGKGTTIGASAGIGVGFFGITGQIARYAPKVGDAITAPGINASMRLLGGPLVPFRIMAQAGASHWSTGGIATTHIPVSIGLAATIPNPAFGIKPWIAPRLDVSRTSGTGITAKTDSHFGISGGIDLSLVSGLTFRGAYDRVSAKGASPSILSFGVGFAL